MKTCLAEMEWIHSHYREPRPAGLRALEAIRNEE